MNDVRIYTDGGCVGNKAMSSGGGTGGWAFVFVINGLEAFSRGGHVKNTTNNRMELTAVIEALKAATMPAQSITVLSDSQYVIRGITDWVHTWRNFGWTTAAKKPVLNPDLWEELYQLVYAGPLKNKVKFEWVRGHSGDVFNEKADSICTQFIHQGGPI